MSLVSSVAVNGSPARAPTKRSMAKQLTRERLVEAARVIFAQRGYDGTTIRDVATSAGLSTGAVFASFSDKDDLFDAVLTADYAAANAAMAEAREAAGPDVQARLKSMLAVGYTHSGRELPLVQAAMARSWVDARTARSFDRKAARPVVALLAETLAAAQAEGELSDALDVNLAAESLWELFLANYRKAVFAKLEADAMIDLVAKQADLLLCGYLRR